MIQRDFDLAKKFQIFKCEFFSSLLPGLLRKNFLIVLDLCNFDRFNLAKSFQIFNYEFFHVNARDLLLLARYSSTKRMDRMESTRLLLDVVIRESTTILQLLSGEDQALLIRRNFLLVLDLGLGILNAIGGLDIKSNGLSGKSLNKDLWLLLCWRA